MHTISHLNSSSRRRKLFSSVSAGALLFLAATPLQAEESDGSSSVVDSVVVAPSIAATAQAPVVTVRAEEDNRYALRLMAQIYDGVEDFSHTQILGFSRVRRGDRSYTQFDFGDGAVMIDGAEGRALSPFKNVSSTEKAVEYDYTNKSIVGDSDIAQFHNTYVRPWLGKGPDLGTDAQWTTNLPLSAFGMGNLSNEDVRIDLSREYFVHDGKPMVLVHYAIPAFSYSLDGKTIIQWARGISLTDPGFGHIYLNSTLHRSAVRENGSVGRPYRYARTMVAANPDGSAMIDYREVPQLEKYIDAFFSKTAMDVIPYGETPAFADQRPLVLAKNMDIIALSIGEDGANDVPTTAAAQLSSDRGQEISNATVFTDPSVNKALNNAGVNAITNGGSVFAGNGSSEQGIVAEELVNTAGPDRSQNGSGSNAELPALSTAERLSGAFGNNPEGSTFTGPTTSQTVGDTGARAMTNDGSTFVGGSGEQELVAEELVHNAQATGSQNSSSPSAEAAAREAANRVDQANNQRTTTGGRGLSTGNLADDVSPETLEALDRSRQSGGGIQDLGRNDPNAVFGGQGDDDQPVSFKLGNAEYLGKSMGGDYLAAVGKTIDEFNEGLGKYGADKFLGAGGAISDLQKLQVDLQSKISTLDATADITFRKLGNLKNELKSVQAQITQLENLVGIGSNPFTEPEKFKFVDDDLYLKTLDRLDDLRAQSRAIVQEVQIVDRQVGYLAQIKNQLPNVQAKLNKLANGIPRSKLANGLAALSDKVGKANGVLGFLGGVGSIGSVYKTSASLGNFDPSNKDLELTGDYSSAGAIASSLTLDLLGIAANAASGNVAATGADVLTFASGRFVDLYKVVSAAEQTRLDTQNTLAETELNRRKAVVELKKKLLAARESGDKAQEDVVMKALGKLANAEEIREIIATLPYESPIYADAPTPGSVSDPNWTDPRIDQKTGLPTSKAWADAKKSAGGRDWLRRQGIDPEAPVGGWPGGVGPEHNPANQTASNGGGTTKKKRETSTGDGPDYPTADRSEDKKDDQVANNDAANDAATGSIPGLGRVETPEEKRARETEERRLVSQKELLEYQKKKIAALEAERERTSPFSDERKALDLEISELVISALKISGFDIDPVTFTGPEFDAPEFKLPEWVPPEFKGPDISKFPPTDPDDLDGYPGTGQYPAFDYEAGLELTFNTDLEKYRDWLEGQDIKKLERLALAAGFPSLAAALGEAEHIIRITRDPSFRQYANRPPGCSPTLGCVGFQGEWTRKRSLVALGDILAPSRGIFSTGGLSDIGISGFNLMYFLRDFGIQDGDLIDVEITQFGRKVFDLKGHFLLTAGSPFNARLRRGVSQMVITAINEGSASPNTAEVSIENVVRGDAVQTYSLRTGETAVLRIEAGAERD